MRPVAAVVVVVTVALIGFACSNEDETADTPGGVAATITAGMPESLDRSGYVAIANQICSELTGDGEMGEPADASSSVDEIEARRNGVEIRLDQLRALPVPQGDEAAIDQIGQAYGRVITALDELTSAVDGDDTQAAALIGTVLDELRSTVNELTVAYGISACSL